MLLTTRNIYKLWIQPWFSARRTVQSNQGGITRVWSHLQIQTAVSYLTRYGDVLLIWNPCSPDSEMDLWLAINWKLCRFWSEGSDRSPLIKVCTVSNLSLETPSKVWDVNWLTFFAYSWYMQKSTTLFLGCQCFQIIEPSLYMLVIIIFPQFWVLACFSASPMFSITLIDGSAQYYARLLLI